MRRPPAGSRPISVSMMMISGGLTRNTARRPRYCVSRPPAAMPAVAPAAVVACQMDSARLRAGPSGFERRQQPSPEHHKAQINGPTRGLPGELRARHATATSRAPAVAARKTPKASAAVIRYCRWGRRIRPKRSEPTTEPTLSKTGHPRGSAGSGQPARPSPRPRRPALTSNPSRPGRQREQKPFLASVQQTTLFRGVLGDGLVAMTVIRRWARRVFKALGSGVRQPADLA